MMTRQAFAFMAAAACGVAATVQAEPLTVYFGTGGAPAKGIYRASFDTQTGKLGPADLAAEIGGPGFLALHSDGSMLYAVAAGADSGTVAVHKVDPETGQLTYQTRNVIQVPAPICVLFARVPQK